MNYTEEIANLTQQNNILNIQNQNLAAEVTLLTARCDQYSQAYTYFQEQILNLPAFK